MNSNKSRTFKRLNQVLSNVLVSMGLDKRLREHTLMSLWPSIVGNSWAEKSRPLFIDHEGNLVVAVADAACGQELSMKKGQILPKLLLAARAVEVQIKNLRFDLKHFYDKTAEIIEEQNNPINVPTEQELANVRLEEAAGNELELVKDQLEKQDQEFFDKGWSKRLTVLCEREFRLRQWRIQQGFPLCPNCQVPLASMYGTSKLCTPCKFAQDNM